MFMILFVYAVFDFQLGAERYVTPYDRPQGWIMVLIGVIFGMIAWMLLARTKMNSQTMRGMIIMIALAAGCAVYPGMLRLNQFTDNLQQVHVYKLTELRKDFKALNNYWAVFDAEASDFPQLVLNDPWGYFEDRAIGSHYQFEIRRGMLGFYQIRLDPKNKKNPAPIPMD